MTGYRGARTCSRSTTCETPSVSRASCTARMRCAAVSTLPDSVTVVPSVSMSIRPASIVSSSVILALIFDVRLASATAACARLAPSASVSATSAPAALARDASIPVDGRSPVVPMAVSVPGRRDDRHAPTATLVVDTTHLSASTIVNNGLAHGEKVHLIERFWLSADGKMLLMQQEFEDPDALENRGARFVGWDRGSDSIYPYECDPSFGANDNKK